jgi:hypothetical protein
MNNPNAVLIITKRRLAGDELPDFGGESFEHARKGALKGLTACPMDESADEEPAEPENGHQEPEKGYQEQLAEVKRLANELQDAVESLEATQEGSGTGEPPEMDSEGSQGAAKVFPPAE